MSGDQGNRKDHLSNINVIASTQTKEGLNLVLIRGDVLCLTADVIVNTVPTDLQLGRGPLSQALLMKAGPMLQKELNATKQGAEEEVGSILMTSGCDLDCKAVLHVVAPGWDNGARSLQIMTNIIKKCLMNVEQLSFSSITFPMLGTGNLRFPKAIFAELMLSEVFKFSSSEWLKTLQEVQLLVHPDDEESQQIFLDEFTRRSNGNLNKDGILKAGDMQDIFGAVSNPEFGTYEMKIGAITFQIASGDITKEKTDVLVNSTARTFNLKSGVSKAILEGAGPAVENECAVLATQPHRDFIVTQGGFLMCKIIMHVLGENDVRKTVSSVLEECEQRKYTSVSLPAIGTDNIPEQWTDMNQQPYCVVKLQPGQSEYDTVKDKFCETCLSHEIEKIERIQNVFLWESYQVKKNHMDTKNGHTNNERQLFHGTDADTVPYINQHGFNRSYAGKNATVFGKGTYFAVDASYSANDAYSRADSSGRKHIYVVRVLTGVYTVGHAAIKSPPPKNPDNPTDLFDSVTDDTRHPKLFVVFSDHQAYPEYLITFRKKNVS
ncbi:protein mono-ADP-ribosyltransferase PARP15 isoform X4 [Equus caballus]|uniref:protein mono-ADP-ribosyltransferase PARP15 isoform X4 n=1 Tax=Equus caballus TaxID=9796 RepID=UPI0038B3B76B